MPVDLTEDDEFTEPVTVPEPGDDRLASSVVSPFQSLANRTRRLLNRLDPLTTPVTVYKFLPLLPQSSTTDGVTFAHWATKVGQQGVWTTQLGDFSYRQDFTLPLGATLRGFEVGVIVSGAGAAPANVTLDYVTPDVNATGGFTDTPANIAGHTAGANNGSFVLSPFIDPGDDWVQLQTTLFRLTCVPGADPVAATTVLRWIRLQIELAGGVA